VELVFEEALIASLFDEFRHFTKGSVIPWFKPLRVVENEEWVFL
jgi:hypothetical protein